jgi:hypothetical protein
VSSPCSGRRGGIPAKRCRRERSEVDDLPEYDQALDAADTPPESMAHVVPSTKAERAGLAPDPDIECVAVLQPARAVSNAELRLALSFEGETGALAGPARGRCAMAGHRRGATRSMARSLCLLLCQSRRIGVPRRRRVLSATVSDVAAAARPAYQARPRSQPTAPMPWTAFADLMFDRSPSSRAN